MLQSLRDRMSGPVFWIIIAILILPFAIWGIGVQSFFGGGADPTLVKVGDAKITQSQFQNAYNRRYAQLVQMMGDNFDASKIHRNQLKQEVLQNLINQSVLLQYAKQSGYRVSDVAIYDYLSEIPAFQDNGHFSDAAYRAQLAQHQLTPAGFEAEVRTALTTEQLHQSVLRSTFLTPKQAIDSWHLKHQARSFDYVVIDTAQDLSTIQISDDDAKQYFQAHRQQFTAPEKIRLAYVELNQATMPKAKPPGTDVLKAIYDAQKNARFTTQEERHASQILIQLGADPAAAHKKIDNIDAQLKQGKSFAELAKKYSDDIGSRNSGGDIGWIKRGMIDPEFEKALFALQKVGEVSAPVRTKFGWHLIKLDGIRPKKVEPFDDPSVQAALIQTYQQRELAKRYQEQSDKLGELAFENPGSLDQVAKALHLKVQQTDWFTRKGGAGIAANQNVIKAAFSDDVLSDGDNSKPIQIGDNDLVVIRKADYQPKKQQSFEDVKQEVIAELKQQRARQQAEAQANKLLADARKAGFAVAAKAENLKVQSESKVTRDDKKVDAALLKSVFSMPRPAASDKTSLGEVSLAPGKVAVIALESVDDGEAPKTQDSDFKQLISNLRDSQAGAEFDAYRAMMKDKIGVKKEAAPQMPEGG